MNRHQLNVLAPPAHVYETVLRFSLRKLPVVRLLFRLRGIPHRKDMTVCEFFSTTRVFRLYWALIGPFSGLIRRLLLAAAKRRAEASMADQPTDGQG